MTIASVGLERGRGWSSLDDGLGASGVGDLRGRRPDRESHRGERALLAAVPDRVAFRCNDARNGAFVVVRGRRAEGVASASIAGIASRERET